MQEWNDKERKQSKQSRANDKNASQFIKNGNMKLKLTLLSIYRRHVGLFGIIFNSPKINATTFIKWRKLAG